jgi:molybdopterin/thiamine biosynthesis adenylyltransferase
MHDASRYVVIGCGGVGGIVLRGLAQFLHTEEPGALVVAVDGDVFEERNRSRQVFDRGGAKPVVLVEELARHYGDRLRLEAVPFYLTAQRARRMIPEQSVVFLAVDNHMSRLVSERRCRRLRDVALFSGGNDGIEDGKTGTYGNVQVYLRSGGRDLTNRLSRFHPEIERPRDRLPTELGCQAQLASAPQLLFVNLQVAAAMLNAFYAWRTGHLAFEELCFDTLTGRAVPVRREVEGDGGAYSSPSPSSSSSPEAPSPPPKR